MEQQQAATPRPDRTSPVGHADGGEPIDVEQAEAALVEHYPRLARLAYLVLPPGPSRGRRVLAAHAVVQRALPRRAGPGAVLPAQRGGDPAVDPGYALMRLRVLRAALTAGRRRWQPPAPLPQVWGLRLFPRSGGADELALDQALSSLSGPARAAFVLRDLERLSLQETRRVLEAAGVADGQQALAEADRATLPAGSRDRALLESVEFDPCALQARPTDLIRRRQHGRAALAAGAAVLVCGALLGLPGEGWGPDGAAAPPYARNAAAEAALDPGRLAVSSATAWKTAARPDFSAWPARGDRTGDRALLRRALAVWARPGARVPVTATPGTPTGPAAGPPQLLFAGVVDHAVVALFHDGLRVVRYAEPTDGRGRADGSGATLDFARTDGAAADEASVLVVGRTEGNIRYLTAPWVTSVRLVDLLKPDAAGQPVAVGSGGLTAPVPMPRAEENCTGWPALRVGGRLDGQPGGVPGGRSDGELLTDLGELSPARLTYGSPDAPGTVSGPEGRTAWARTACQLPAVRSQGVRTVNTWRFAQQPLPGGGGVAAWLCTRAETWRGAGSRTMAQFQAPPPSGQPYATGAVTARVDGGTACGPRAPRVLSGVLWKSAGGQWWLLAAGSEQVTSITASGGVQGRTPGRLLTVPATAGAHADLKGELAGGRKLRALR
ncbi:RNA polymerase sigma factor [Streptomyces sp. NPDC004296]|uniref:RNA polymerase sigma factor n=1 Tax=Streptomyces sp. NPDC004296 TaxID=3364697 RepID=UPI003678CA2B